MATDTTAALNESLKVWRVKNAAAYLDRRAYECNKLAAERLRPNAYRKDISGYDIIILYWQQGGQCLHCEELIEGQDYHIDHKNALHRGGAHAFSNLALLHATCNLDKGVWSGKEVEQQKHLCRNKNCYNTRQFGKPVCWQCYDNEHIECAQCGCWSFPYSLCRDCWVRVAPVDNECQNCGQFSGPYRYCFICYNDEQ